MLKNGWWGGGGGWTIEEAMAKSPNYSNFFFKNSKFAKLNSHEIFQEEMNREL